jgi:iron complex transport system substrate-binding protein
MKAALAPRSMAVLLGGLCMFANANSASALERPTYLGPPKPKQVRRVVTLAPSLTDVVVALGAEELLVGVSRFDELPAVSKLPRVGGFIDPSIEAVIALKPDLVLVQPAPNNKAPVEKIASLGAPVLAVPLHSVEDARVAIAEIGAALNLAPQARKLIASLDEARQKVRARAQQTRPVKVLVVYGFAPLVVAGPGSFIHELLSDAGASNAAQGVEGAYAVYSAERLVRMKPEILVDASDTSAGAEKLRSLEGLESIRWIKLPSKKLMHPGPQLGAGLEELFRLLHPEAQGRAPR